MLAAIQRLSYLLLPVVMLAIFSSATSLHFKWNASIDRSTGIATSRETSAAPYSCSLCRAMNSSRTPAKLVESVFGRYPSWLAGWRVTFGCLRAVPTMDEKNSIHATALRDSLCGVTLLSFGQGRFHVRRKLQTEYRMVIPIVGGLMALPSSKGSYGSLVFSLIRNDDGNDSLSLVTSIADDYRPAIAGSPPVSRLRAGLYRSSQSLFHAYIMWRFHHYCSHQSE